MTTPLEKVRAAGQPDYLERLSAEQLRELRVNELSQGITDVAARVTDPAYLQAEVNAAAEFGIRSHINYSLWQSRAGGATGRNLDFIAAHFNIERALDETDDSLRNRVLTAPIGATTATLAGVEASARAAAPGSVWGARAVKSTSTVHILQNPSDVESGELPGVPSATLLATVRSHVNSRPLSFFGLTITVSAGTVTPFYVTGVVSRKPGFTVDIADVRAAFEGWRDANLVFGGVLRNSQLVSVLSALRGVDFVTLTRFTDVAANATEVKQTIPTGGAGVETTAYSARWGTEVAITLA